MIGEATRRGGSASRDAPHYSGPVQRPWMLAWVGATVVASLGGCGEGRIPAARPDPPVVAYRAVAARVRAAGSASRAQGSGAGRPTAARARRAGRGGRARAAARCQRRPPERLISHRRWLSRVQITEYYPAPERWFAGRRVTAPGLSGKHRVDWLYSARGLSMEGDGVDFAGHKAHISKLGSVGWVNAAGHATRAGTCAAHWSRGSPDWRAGGWRNASGAVTFPLEAGGWSHGVGHWRGGYGGATFAPGSSLPLRYYHSVAVDPHLIPRGSRIFIPAYRAHGGGWFRAQDTGGAIIGRHLDVYRPPPANPSDKGQLLTNQRVYVVPPGR